MKDVLNVSLVVEDGIVVIFKMEFKEIGTILVSQDKVFVSYEELINFPMSQDFIDSMKWLLKSDGNCIYEHEGHVIKREYRSTLFKNYFNVCGLEISAEEFEYFVTMLLKIGRRL